MTVHGYILERGEGQRFSGGMAKLVSGLADFSVFESLNPPSPVGVPAHIHDVYDEAFYVLDGEMQYVLDDVPRRCGPGAFVFVPRGTSHRFLNPGSGPARVLTIGSSGVQALVEELVPLLMANRPESPVVVNAFAKYHTRLAVPREK